ncbi:PTS maltose transporter subunit IICB [Facklamia sp. DSM 111018]|uniref:PTS maltose transporter subunit IICB n=1 Tax=Facklamia lactis TaxID=2749967 RepID=A0ABS0LUA4_9LACT|nr:maltose/glucose-specific PTS transporter subunit IIBC [Facklamia lactis]MBG9981083.1 PTS maltose transporter subunit IICB [Facklamia lactis]MBG9986884.1 PTS maltose transporter subunit IICB [Facklamia lactis]
MDRMNKKSSKMEFLQGLGKTFMLPVALLAFMGLLLGIGSSFASPAVREQIPILDHEGLQFFFNFLSTVGGFAFTYLPVMFAMAIPLGLVRKEKGVAAFSGFVGYTVMHLTINFVLSARGLLSDEENLRMAGQGLVFGIQTLEMGVLGGIIAGLVIYQLHQRFYRIQLHDSFSFFSGVRFVPIISALVMAILGLFLPYVWPIFASGIALIGTLIQKSGVFGPFLFGAGERLLLPFGLHHILVAMIRFTHAGGSALVDGHQVDGALNIFYEQLSKGELISPQATAFLSQGKMPTFIFGLPAAALAMYHTALPERRDSIKGLLISGVVATAVTGITEPIEFLFLFVSPLLWVFHVVMTGLGFMVMALLGVTIGNTDGGILDFAIFGVLQGNGTKWYLVLLVGLIWFIVYYFVFKIVIRKKNLQTPGRAIKEVETNYSDQELTTSGKGHYDIPAILANLGGKDNILSLDNCVTRLRLVVKDGSMVDDQALEDLGALGVVHLDDQNVQVIIGTKVTSVKNELEDLI